MKKFLCAAPALLLLFGSTSSAAVVFTTGAGSAVTSVQASADFENTAALFSNPYIEGGMSFSRTGLSFNNNGCGFAGCGFHAGFYAGPTPFSGNYMYGVGSGGYFTIKSLGADFTGLEFIAGNGGGQGISVNWTAFKNGSQVGTGSSPITAPAWIGFKDAAGFDEIRYTTNQNAPAFDKVRAQFTTANVPEPSTFAIWGLGLAAFVGLRRRRRS